VGYKEHNFVDPNYEPSGSPEPSDDDSDYYEGRDQLKRKKKTARKLETTSGASYTPSLKVDSEWLESSKQLFLDVFYQIR